jgi:transposase-like protein
MEAAEPIVGRRRVRQFRTTQEKRFIVEETRKTGLSVATVAQAHGVNANQVFYWRKLYEAGQLESTVAQSTGDLGARGVRLLPVSVDEGRNGKPRLRGWRPTRSTQQGVTLCRARSS